jgi:AmmeMemoRadiSam system protein A
MPFLPHRSLPSETQSPQLSLQQAGEFSEEERACLLRVAHEAIETLVENRHLDIEAPNPHFREPRGVFTTIYLHRELRGCVGYVFPVTSLYRAVIETARAAASQDTRFRPVGAEETRHIRISLSVISPLSPVLPDQLEVGRHGLVVTLGVHRGLLLPQVPIEHNWDRVTFLEQTCRKAGLPADAWRNGATLEAFTAEVFSDPES